MSKLKAKLNPMQQKAVLATEGPVLIIAGPGSGKTHTLVERITNIVKTKKANPDEIFVTTFTEKAAKEIKTRVSNRLTTEGILFNLNDMYIGTFHSICLRILDEYQEFTRLKRNFRVMDSFDQQFFIYQNLSSFHQLENFSYLMEGSTRKWDQSGRLLQWINKISDELLDKYQLQNSQFPAMEALGKCYELYQKILKDENSLDFSAIQLEAYLLLMNHPHIRESLRRKIKYIMVDEYQDTNTIQEKIVLSLTNDHNNLCVVGDDDQGLYRFRGATIRNILEFPSYFKNCTQIKLKTNYRSHPDIIQFYNQWMEDLNWKENNRTFRYEKDIIPPEDLSFHNIPSVVKVEGSLTQKNWHDEIYHFLMILKSNNAITDWNQVAFLFSSVKSQEVIELSRFLEVKGIPVYSPRSNLFFKREEIKLMLGAYMYLFPQTTHARQWNPAINLTAWEFHDQCQRAFEKALNSPENKDFKLWAVKKAKEHLNARERFKYGFSELFYECLQFPVFSRYLDDFNGQARDSRASRNLSIFSNLIVKFEYLVEMDVIIPNKLNHILINFWNRYIPFLLDGGITEYEDESEYAPSGCVSFLTIHQSKGLEFPVVLVGSLDKEPWLKVSNVDRLLAEFHSKQSFEPQHRIAHYDFWRLYYTAFSRAQNLLVLTGQLRDGKRSCPSKVFQPYLSQLPDWKHVKITNIEYDAVKEVRLKESYSFTSHINVYNSCPLQYKFFKELGFEPVKKENQIFGTVVHQTIEDIHKAIIDGAASVITSNLIEQLFKINYYHLTKRERIYLKEESKAAALKQVKRYVENNQGQWDKVKGAEVKFTLVKENYILNGNVDLIREVDGSYEIVDFKTGEKSPSDRDRLRQYQKQLEAYAHLIEEQENKKVKRMHIYFTGEEKDSPYLTFEKSNAHIKETMKSFDVTIQNIEKGNYKINTRPKQHCERCDMKPYCDKKENTR